MIVIIVDGLVLGTETGKLTDNHVSIVGCIRGTSNTAVGTTLVSFLMPLNYLGVSF